MPIESVALRKFDGGINNQDDARFMPVAETQIAKNLTVLGRDGTLRARWGDDELEYPNLTGAGVVRLYDFNGALYYLAEHDLYRRVAGGADVLIGSNIAGSHGRGVVARGRLYIVDTSYDPHRIDDADNADLAGLRAPRTTDFAAPTITPNTSTGLVADGTYYYRFSYAYGDNDELGVSYNLAPASQHQQTAVMSGGPGYFAFSGLPTAANLATYAGRPTKLIIWRTLMNGLSGGPYYKVADHTGAGGATTYNDLKNDYELLEEHDKVEEGLPPRGKHLAFWRDRLWMATSTARELRASSASEADFWPSDLVFNVATVDSSIDGLLAFGEYLYVFTSRRVLVLTGEDENNFVLRPVYPEIGLLAADCFAPAGAEVWMFNEQAELWGIRGFNAYKIQDRFIPVQQSLKLATIETERVRPSVYAYHDGIYTIPTYENYLIDIETQSVRAIAPFGDDTHYASGYPAGHVLLQTQDDGTQKVYSIKNPPGAAGLILWELFLDKATDDTRGVDADDQATRGFDCHLRTAELDFGEPTKHKILMSVEVCFDQAVTPKSGTTNEIRIYTDGSYGAAQVTHTIQSGDRRVIVHGVDDASASTVAKLFTIDVQWTDESNRIAIEEIIVRFQRLPLRLE
jgi:hypothetical protein